MNAPSVLPSILTGSSLVVADGGLETTLVFDHGLDLEDFAAFPLLATAEGREHLRRYYAPYIALAVRTGLPMLLDTATWRANLDWGSRLGYDATALREANRQAVALVRELAAAEPTLTAAVNGAIGPRGDGYRAEAMMTPAEATRYHSLQTEAFADAAVDTVTAVTMTHVGEAAGVALAARAAELPAIISFTVETDGRLPSGQPLGEAVTEVDALSDGWPIFYMVNCAHPTHFEDVFDGAPWTARIGGVRGNASRLSHAELDEAEELDAGDPVELAEDYGRLRERLPALKLVGGCCGTDVRHVDAIVSALHAIH